jgi:hypothetical protein
MLEKVKKYSGTLAKTAGGIAKDFIKNYSMIKEMMGPSKRVSDLQQCFECPCGDFICENTDSRYTLKKFQEFLLPNFEIDLTKLICSMSEISGYPAYTIGIGLGGIGLSYLAYHQYQKYAEQKNDNEPVEKNDTIASPKQKSV